MIRGILKNYIEEYKIFEYVKNYAKEKHCYNLTLNVWALNESAKKFYEKSKIVSQFSTFFVIYNRTIHNTCIRK